MTAEPATIGRYRILAKVGQGGMGAVFKAVDPASGAVVALKVITADTAGDPRFLERFQREAVAAAAIKHPNVTAFHENGVDGGRAFLALEFVSGGSLQDRLKLGTMPWREAAASGAQIARGLAAIHAAGMVHRDLKPANVLLDERGIAKVTDLGIARVRMLGAAALTRTGELMGTVAYMAPEQTEGAKSIGPPADLYALGATLYALLTGGPPFHGTPTEIVTKLLTTMPEPPRAIVPAVPRELDAIVMRLLAKAPAERAIDASSVAGELEALLALEPAKPRSRGVALALAGVAVLGAAVAVVLFASPRERPPLEASEAREVAARSPESRPATPAVPQGELGWFAALPAAERPALPLPGGLEVGTKKGEYLNPKDGSVLVYVPGGTFVMGRDRAEHGDETPAHEVELAPYFIGKYELTKGKLARFLRETKRKTMTETATINTCTGMDNDTVSWGYAYSPGGRLTWESPYLVAREIGPQNDDHPAVQVSYEDAEAYCLWAGLDLPTEAEWERAATWDAAKRVKLKMPWGDELPNEASGPLANFCDLSVHDIPEYVNVKIVPGYRDGFPRSAPVGSFPRDVSPVGAYDMAGNVHEICKDFFDPEFYSHSPRRNPVCTKRVRPDSEHTRRGNSWSARKPLITFRGNMSYPALSDTGFRVAKSWRR